MVNARYIAGCAAVLVGIIAGGCNPQANDRIRRLTELGVEQAIVSGVRTKMEGPRSGGGYDNGNNGYVGNNTGYEGGQSSPEETARFEAALRERGMLGGQINNSSPEEIDRFERALREHGMLGRPNK